MEKKIPHVLLIYRRMIPSIRLCGHCQMEALAAEGKVEYRAVPGLRLTRGDLEWAEIALLGRLDSWYELQVSKLLKRAGKTLVYVIDDDLLNVPAEVSSASYYNQESIRRNIREILEMSDAVMSPSPLLLRKYAKGKRAIRIEEPAIGAKPYIPHDPEKPVKIGFAGSIDRMGDLEKILGEALPEVKRKYGDKVAFEFFGAKPSFAGELEAGYIPYTESYDEYRETLEKAEWDIGLAPMPETPFHACKHYNKFVEYAAAGIAGIYSNVPPYDRLVAFPGCAMLCGNTAGEWTEALSSLVEDASLREEMRKKAAECAAGALGVERCGAQLLQELDTGRRERGSRTDGRIPSFRLEIYKAGNLLHRGRTFLKAHGAAGSVKRLMEKIRGEV